LSENDIDGSMMVWAQV